MFVGDILGRRALYTPDDLAVVDAGKDPHRPFTYSEMNNRANRLANWLRDGAGVQKGDRVAILAHDGVEHLDTFFACGKLGAIHVPLNWRLHWRELLNLIEDTTPRVLVFSDAFRDAVANIIEHASSVHHILHIDGKGLPSSRYFEKTLSDSILRPVVTETVTEEDIACLIFTGGTSGLPKGAQISHRMIGWNTLNTIVHDLRHGDITVNSFPLFHTGGLLVYTTPLLVLGGTVVLTRKFDAEQVVSLLQEYAATVYAGVPTMYQMMMSAPNFDEADLSSLRFCTSGGAPLPISLVQTFNQQKGIQFKQGFGMSEFGPGVFALAPEDAIRKAGSIGRPNFFVDARIVDDENNEVPPDTVGELVLRGPSLCSGYFNNPDESQRAVDDEGWFHTGDLATRDDEHYFFIVDRKKDLYISGGEKIYPTEIEQVIYLHPDVQMCAVIGVPDDKWGEVGRAFIVLKAGAMATADDLTAHLQHHLAGYKVPRYIEIVDQLPISGAGKILKRELAKVPVEGS
ncbi:MAG: long-chain fatty acid--CoA ligase [Anaerolineae bacterium]|nr:long-chain fatty acid--CoA ligase [Anaerolineae bacterium]MCA9893639.1 long-chain fatty acid--CoA ligase [Anaerolineae bacterium]